MGKNGSFWSRITPYTETLLAGSYAGCLVAFLAAHYSPDETKGIVDALGQAIVLPLVIFVGVAAYLIYRQILGEFFLYPVRHLLLSCADRIYRKVKQRPHHFISFTQLLDSKGVRWPYRRLAYTELRRRTGVLDGPQRQGLDVLHGTYHFLYLTSLALFAASWIERTRPERGWLGIPVGAFVLLALAYVVDLRQDVWECRLLQQKDKELDDLVHLLGFDGSPGSRETEEPKNNEAGLPMPQSSDND